MAILIYLLIYLQKTTQPVSHVGKSTVKNMDSTGKYFSDGPLRLRSIYGRNVPKFLRSTKPAPLSILEKSKFFRFFHRKKNQGIKKNELSTLKLGCLGLAK